MKRGDASNFFETIHAMDIALYTLVSNPSLPCPLLEPSATLKDFLDLISRDTTVVKPQQKSKKQKSISTNLEESTSQHNLNQQNYLSNLQQSDLSNDRVDIDNTQTIRSSTRLKALSTRIFMIKERGDAENLDEINAEDIKYRKLIVKLHIQLFRSIGSKPKKRN